MVNKEKPLRTKFSPFVFRLLKMHTCLLIRIIYCDSMHLKMVLCCVLLWPPKPLKSILSLNEVKKYEQFKIILIFFFFSHLGSKTLQIAHFYLLRHLFQPNQVHIFNGINMEFFNDIFSSSLLFFFYLGYMLFYDFFRNRFTNNFSFDDIILQFLVFFFLLLLLCCSFELKKT